MTDPAIDWPVVSFPDAEARTLEQHYKAAEVILEFGSGGSTVMASRIPGKLVFSVETDRRWATDLQRRIDEAGLPSPAILYPVDIGPTGEWGRPLDASKWQSFHRYPIAVWSEPWFRHPDVILIDGRLRPACFVAAYLRISRPVTVLFDDYRDRESYHIVEELEKPSHMVGRMAEFRLEPGKRPVWVQDLLLELCTKMSYSTGAVDYSKKQSKVLTMRQLTHGRQKDNRGHDISPNWPVADN